MINFKFNETKATQIVIRFLQKKATDQNNYTKILKLLYICDREALKRWGRPLTGDHPVSMENGLLLSNIYDLIKSHPSESYWSKHISERKGYNIELIGEPSKEELSLAETRLIDEIYEKYKLYTYGDMIEETHNLPEWQDPTRNGEKIVSVDNENILRYLDFNEVDILEIKSEIENLNYTRTVLLNN